MANTTGYMGFKFFGMLPGYAPDMQLSAVPIAGSNSTAIYRGDAVIFSSGNIIAASTGTGQIDGVFDGCTYVDSTGNTRWSPYCPASQTATGYVINAPGAMFLAQSNGTAISRANVNKNAGYVIGTGQTTGGGFSLYTLNAAEIITASTGTFRIVGLFSDYAPSAVNGTDNSSNNNICIVTFNNQDFRSGQVGI
jgi:hypothetical protein